MGLGFMARLIFIILVLNQYLVTNATHSISADIASCLEQLRTRKLEEIAGRGGTQNKSSMRNNIDNGNDVAAVDSGMNGTEGFPSSSGATSHSDVLKQEASDDL